VHAKRNRGWHRDPEKSDQVRPTRARSRWYGSPRQDRGRASTLVLSTMNRTHQCGQTISAKWTGVKSASRAPLFDASCPPPMTQHVAPPFDPPASPAGWQNSGTFRHGPRLHHTRSAIPAECARRKQSGFVRANAAVFLVLNLDQRAAKAQRATGRSNRFKIIVNEVFFRSGAR